MSEETIGGLIMIGLWVAFMAVLIIVNKKRGVIDIGEKPYRPSWESGVPTGTLEADSAPRANDNQI